MSSSSSTLPETLTYTQCCKLLAQTHVAMASRSVGNFLYGIALYGSGYYVIAIASDTLQNNETSGTSYLKASKGYFVERNATIGEEIPSQQFEQSNSGLIWNWQ